ncbi:MAG: hypothetical protein WA888_00745, partial [Burkholderiaceae bacterium]
DAGYGPVGPGWINIGWGGYSTANGETHPAVGNLDGDGAEEVVLGTGAGGGRYLRLMGDAADGFTPGAWVLAGDTGSIAPGNHAVWP